jgi:hypothetical protein
MLAAPRLVAATSIGGAGDDRIEGVTILADGSIVIAGTLASPLSRLPDGTVPRVLGQPQPQSKYGVGFVALLDRDGRSIRRFVQFAPGLCTITTVAARTAPNASSAIYIAGYGHASLDAMLPNAGRIAPMDFSHKARTRWAPQVHRHDPMIADALDERGQPFVARLNDEWTDLDAGAWLEGWQSVWHVPPPLNEDQWQPVDLAVLPEGDLLVAHDGGIIGDHGSVRPDHRHYYHLPDYVSRISPDLQTRRWRMDVYTPPNAREKVKTYLGWDWPHETLGNTRIHRMRAARDGGQFTIVGWSPSETSREPWWSPFCFVYDTDAKAIHTLYTPSPMAGSDGRMNGLVSDAAVASVNYDPTGNLLLAVKGDGGNSILLRDPRDFTQPVTDAQWKSDLWGFGGRTLFWGGVVRVDGQTGALQRGFTIHGRTRNRVTAAWPIDLAPLEDGRVVVAARHSDGFRFTDDAWSTDQFPPRQARPGGSVMLLDANLRPTFISSLGAVRPTRVESFGRRVVIVGIADVGNVVSAHPIMPPGGGRDGYVLVLEVPEPAERAH